jgi:hypothetical protein
MDGIDNAGKAVTKAQKRLAAAQAKVATAKDPAMAQEKVVAAKKELDRAADWLQRDIRRAEARGKDLNVSTKHLERVEGRAGKSTEAPRQDMKAPFDPKNRRPDLSDVKNVPKDLKVGRPGDAQPDARVSVHRAKVRSDLQAQHDALIAESTKEGSDNKALGHVYERLLVDDLTPGAKKGFRMESDAGDKTRKSDHGVHEITLEGDMSSGKLDQIWRDLLAVTPGDNKPSNTAIVTVPTLSPTSERQLVKMAFAYEQLTGRRPTIIVRETVVPK